jgi:hypothetical protein
MGNRQTDSNVNRQAYVYFFPFFFQNILYLQRICANKYISNYILINLRSKLSDLPNSLIYSMHKMDAQFGGLSPCFISKLLNGLFPRRQSKEHVNAP